MCIPVSPINKQLLLSGRLNDHAPFTWVSAILYTSILPIYISWDAGQKSVWLARRFVQGCISNTNHVNEPSTVPINASLLVVYKHMEVL